MTTFSVATVLAPLVLWLPGAFVWVLVHGGSVSSHAARVGFRAYAWVYALGVLLVHYLVQEVLLDHVLGIRTGHGFALGLFVGGVGALVGATLALRRGPALSELVVDARSALVPYLVFAVLCTALATQGVAQPIPKLRWNHVSDRTFGLQSTHDNYFQFVNGKAIAEHVPFSTFYANGVMVYPVTSRGILPGVLYSSWRRIVGGLKPSWADRFAWYLLFGIAANAMVVFALDALRLRLGLRLSPWLLLAMLSTSAFFLVNGYFTWFKLCGAAFFLSGIVALLARPSLTAWAAAGVLWGASASMHQGNALGFPIVALWALARARVGIAGRAALVGAMAAAFVAAMLPWQVVMAIYFPPDLLLVAAHYLGGHQAPTLGATVQAFLTSTSWEAQLSHRLGSLVTALRVPESIELLAGWTWEAPEVWQAALPRYRFGYAAIMLHPVALGALAARIAAPRQHTGRDATGLLVATLAGLVVAILAHYSWWYADWVPHLPLGLVVLAYVLLADRCVAWRWTHAALVGLVVFEGTLTLAMLTSGTNQTMLPGHCVKPGICGHALMLHDADSFELWTP